MRATTPKRTRVIALSATVGALSFLLVAYTGGEVEGAGSIRGTVRMTGTAPSLPAHHVEKREHHPACGTSVPNEDVVTGPGGTLGNVVVWIDGIERGAPAKRRSLTLDQQRCRYVPRVQAATRGSRLTITSSDDTLHNTHGFMGKRTVFNLALPTKGVRIPRTLTQTGRVDISCDAGHTWMRGYVHVFDHPYFAVTGADGRFELGDVPPGRHALKAWHERFGEQTGQVTVGPGGAATWDVSFRAR